MVFLTINQIYNQKRNIICQIDGGFHIVSESQYMQCQNPSKSSNGIFLNQQTLNFFIKLTQQIQRIMPLWIEGILKNGLEYLYVLNWDKNNARLSREQYDKLIKISIKSVEKYQQLMRNNKDFVINHRNNEMINHPQFFKDVQNLIFKNWINNALIFINNLHQLLKEDQSFCQKLLNLQINVKENLFYQVEAIKMKMFAQYQKSIIFVPTKIVNNQIQSKQQNKQNNCPNDKINIKMPFFINQIQLIQSFSQIQIINDQSQNKIKPKTIKRLNSIAINQIIQSLTVQNKKLSAQNVLIKNQNQRLSQDNKSLISKLQNLTLQKRQLNRYSSKKQKLDSQLLQEVIQLQVQLADKNKDIQMLTKVINQCLKNGQINKSMLNSHCRNLKTINIDI